MNSFRYRKVYRSLRIVSFKKTYDLINTKKKNNSFCPAFQTNLVKKTMKEKNDHLSLFLGENGNCKQIKRKNKIIFRRATAKYKKISLKCKLLSDQMEKKLAEMKKETSAIEDLLRVKVKATSINSFFLCSLCNGYFYNATTITECLHTFCKGCLVHHLMFSLHCPKCSTLVHPTDPFVNIKHDSTIQDLLYRLMPRIEKEEVRREIMFEKDQLIRRQVLDNQSSLHHHNEKEDLNCGGDEECFVLVQLNFLGISQRLECKMKLEHFPYQLLLSVPSNSTISLLRTFLHIHLNLLYDVQVILLHETYLLGNNLLMEQVPQLQPTGSQALAEMMKKKIVFINYALIQSGIDSNLYFQLEESGEKDFSTDKKINNLQENINQ